MDGRDMKDRIVPKICSGDKLRKTWRRTGRHDARKPQNMRILTILRWLGKSLEK